MTFPAKPLTSDTFETKRKLVLLFSEESSHFLFNFARKGRERACKNIFDDPLPFSFGSMKCRKVKISTCQSFKTFVHLPLSFRSLDISLLHLCL